MPLETVKRLNQSDRKYSFYAFYLVSKILISSGDDFICFSVNSEATLTSQMNMSNSERVKVGV